MHASGMVQLMVNNALAKRCRLHAGLLVALILSRFVDVWVNGSYFGVSASTGVVIIFVGYEPELRGVGINLAFRTYGLQELLPYTVEMTTYSLLYVPLWYLVVAVIAWHETVRCTVRRSLRRGGTTLK